MAEKRLGQATSEDQETARRRPIAERRRSLLIKGENPEDERVRRGERAKLLRDKNRLRARR